MDNLESIVPTSEFRENIKQHLEDVTNGKVILITKHGKVIARIAPEESSEEKEAIAYKKRLKAYKNGGITINSDIINQPLKELDYIDDSLFTPPSIAAEPDEQ